MSDLKTVIAEAIFNSDYNHRYNRIDMWGAYQYANAVIATLGLIRDPFSTVAFERYVTQWQPNDRFKPYCNRCGIPHTDQCKRDKDTP